MFRAIISLIILLLAGIPCKAQGADQDESEAWSVIPEGARPSYMGIHGGTMPVSLLVSGDGSSLFSFVGRTGNDFVETLRKAHIPLPSFGNSTRAAAPQSRADANIFAGNATASLPVFSIASGVLDMTGREGRLVPFGLSREPLSIEGSVTKPEHFPHARTIRPFRLPDYFRPRDSKR